MTSMKMLEPGDVLDHYRVDATVARSGMATLYRATEVENGRQVALKVPHPEMEADPVLVERLVTNLIDNAGEDNNTAMIGLGGRFRVMSKMYLVGEVTPRVGGYMPGVTQMSFGIQGRAGGHLFQLNFSNGLGTTLGQLARGGINYNSWFIGFNLTRKFF